MDFPILPHCHNFSPIPKIFTAVTMVITNFHCHVTLLFSVTACNRTVENIDGLTHTAAAAIITQQASSENVAIG